MGSPGPVRGEAGVGGLRSPVPARAVTTLGPALQSSVPQLPCGRGGVKVALRIQLTPRRGLVSARRVGSVQEMLPFTSFPYVRILWSTSTPGRI